MGKSGLGSGKISHCHGAEKRGGAATYTEGLEDLRAHCAEDDVGKDQEGGGTPVHRGLEVRGVIPGFHAPHTSDRQDDRADDKGCHGVHQ